MKKDKDDVRIITCKEAEKSFNDLIDGFLLGKTKIELEHHIIHCQHCYGRIEFESKLKERIRSVFSNSSPKTLRNKIEALLESN